MTSRSLLESAFKYAKAPDKRPMPAKAPLAKRHDARHPHTGQYVKAGKK